MICASLCFLTLFILLCQSCLSKMLSCHFFQLTRNLAFISRGTIAGRQSREQTKRFAMAESIRQIPLFTFRKNVFASWFVREVCVQNECLAGAGGIFFTKEGPAAKDTRRQTHEVRVKPTLTHSHPNEYTERTSTCLEMYWKSTKMTCKLYIANLL